MAYKFLKGKLVVKGDAQIDAGLAEAGAVKVPGQTIDDLGEISGDLKLNDKNAINGAGAKLVQEGALHGVKSDLEAADAGLQAGLDAEVSRASGEESRIEGKFDAEVLRIDGDVATNSSDIASEEAARIAGDASLQSQINDILSNVDPAALDSLTEIVSAFQSADSDLEASITAVLGTHTSELSAEEAARIAGDNALGDAIDAVSGSLDAEILRAITAESALQGEIDAEETLRASEITRVEGLVSAEQTRAQTAEAGLQSGLDAEIARATDAEAVLSGSIASEVNRATTAEAALQAAIDAEEAARIAADDAEALARAGADGDLSLLATATKLNLVGAINEVHDELDAEVARATAAEGVLTSNLDAEVVRATAAEALLTTNLNQEIADRIAGDNAEAAARTAADNVLQGNIDTLRSDMDAADLVLSGSINDEKNRALAAEQALQNSINAETTRATNAEAGLQGQINDILSNTDPAALDSLTEIVEAFQSADSDLNAAITAALGTHTSELAVEEAARIAGDAALQAALDQEILDRIADVDAEESRALAAEAVLSGSIASEIARATSEEARIEGKFDAEVVRIDGDVATNSADIAAETAARIAGDDALGDAIFDLSGSLDEEILRATTAEAGLQSAIDAEEARALAAEAVLQTAIDDEEARATAAEATLQSNIDALSATHAADEAAMDARMTAREEGMVSTFAMVDAGMAVGGVFNVPAEAHYVFVAGVDNANTPTGPQGFTLELPNGVVGKTIVVKHAKVGAGFEAADVTVQGMGGQLIDSEVSVDLNEESAFTVVFFGGMWQLV